MALDKKQSFLSVHCLWKELIELYRNFVYGLILTRCRVRLFVTYLQNLGHGCPSDCAMESESMIHLRVSHFMP